MNCRVSTNVEPEWALLGYIFRVCYYRLGCDLGAGLPSLYSENNRRIAVPNPHAFGSVDMVA